MNCCRSGSVRVLFAAILLFGFLISPAHAEIFYDVGIKSIYEDNVVGLLSDGSSGRSTVGYPGSGGSTMMRAAGSGQGSGPGAGGEASYTGTSTEKNSDVSFDITADIGFSTRWGINTDIFFSGDVERITYVNFTEFNMTAAALSAGITRQFGDSISARLSATGLVKRFEDVARDSSSYVASILLRERISSRVRLKESFAYEQNQADSAFFSYTGKSFNFRSGYSATDRTALFAGYSYLMRDYDEGSEEKANIFSLGLEWEFFRNWLLDLQFDRRFSDYTDPALQTTTTTSNIYSLGARYSY